ncbi:unnamed protein product, partial [Tetraodon nigroviridis]
QPSVSGMEPPFGDAFQNYSFVDQALTSTELLATSSDPDFMYELDRDTNHQQSPCGDSMVGVGDGGKEVEGCVDQLMGLGECETVHSSSAFEQWDSYWEDLTRYTRLASCDIWGTKEVDFLGLDDFSSPYQDEEVIGRTPTLAQLNSEDSLPVCEALYPPADLSLPGPQPQSQPPQLPCHSKRPVVPGSVRSSSSSTSSSRPSRSPLPDFAEGSQKATRPVPSSTETMAKNQNLFSLSQDYGQGQPKLQARATKMAAPAPHNSDFVPPASSNLMSFERRVEATGRTDVPAGWSSAVPHLVEANRVLEVNASGLASESVGAAEAICGGSCDMELMEDIKGLTAGVSSRKRGKRRYFWEYSEQLPPSKQERMLKPSEWDRHTLPSNLYQKNGPLHGKYMLKKSRRTDVEDLTPNPRKLLQIGTELRKLNKVISDLTPVSELPLTARPRSRKEKNKLASRACRLKKKAQYEANKVKLWGLSTEYDRLLFVINTIKEEIVARVEDSSPRPTNMTDTLEHLIQQTLGENPFRRDSQQNQTIFSQKRKVNDVNVDLKYILKHFSLSPQVAPPVAGQTSDFVNKILDNTGRGDPTGGLVGLRVPTSKI